MAHREDQIAEITVLADQYPVFGSCSFDMLGIGVGRADQRGPENVMPRVRQSLRNAQTYVDVEQEFQAARALPIAA